MIKKISKVTWPARTRRIWKIKENAVKKKIRMEVYKRQRKYRKAAIDEMVLQEGLQSAYPKLHWWYFLLALFCDTCRMEELDRHREEQAATEKRAVVDSICWYVWEQQF